MGIGVHAPGINSRPGVAPYVAAHNVLLSHAEAYHLYDEQYRVQQQGQNNNNTDHVYRTIIGVLSE